MEKSANKAAMSRPREMGRKEKLTCRLDRPRGRKPSCQQTQSTDRRKPSAVAKLQFQTGAVRHKISGGRKKGNKMTAMAAQNDQDVPCLYCGENFSDSRSGEQ